MASRLSSAVRGEDGGFDMKTGLGVVKFAGSMYMNMMTGKMLMNAFNTSMAGNLQGMHAGQSRAHEYADLTDALQGASKGCG